MSLVHWKKIFKKVQSKIKSHLIYSNKYPMRITKGKTKLLNSWMHLRLYLTCIQRNTVKPVYRGHSREPENVDFISSCPLYIGYNYMQYSLIGKMRLPFIDSDLLYRGALYSRLDCTWLILIITFVLFCDFY